MAMDGILYMVKCKVCSTIDHKPCVIVPKSDTLFKHNGKHIAKTRLALVPGKDKGALHRYAMQTPPNLEVVRNEGTCYRPRTDESLYYFGG